MLLLLAAGPVSSQPWWSITDIDGAPVRSVLPPDAIRAIDDPSFPTGHAADRQMAGDEAVLGIRLGGVARAYPLGYLSAHEILNDEIDGAAIAVTW